MDRKKFIKNLLLTGVIGSIAPQTLKGGKDNKSSLTSKETIPQVGYNHLPNQEKKTANTVIHKAKSRGHANHGWLNSHHSFSFANYHNPDRMNFGALRVLNDDTVEAGMGFGTHPHDNMEIISIPLEGDLEHKDSMGNVAVIKEGDVQVLSAGSGITHSEYNKNKDKSVKFLQIWVFPKVKNLQPRYDQISISDIEKKNEFYQILSPIENDAGVWITQDAWFHLGKFDKGIVQEYAFKKEGNGVYAFVLNGDVIINDEPLSTRDAMGIWDTNSIKVEASTDSRILLMEVPMNLS